MKSFRIYLLGTVLAGVLFSGCDSNKPADAPYDSKLYLNMDSKTDKIALKVNVVSAVRTLQVAVPKPAEADVEVIYEDDVALVDTYNQAFYDNAVALPAAYYELSATTTMLNKGTVLSNAVEVSFRDLDRLPRTQTYVLPVTIARAGMPVLESRRTVYYVLKSAPSIEVVADMEKKNYVKIPTIEEGKPAAAILNDLRRFTFETLICAHKFDPGIQTIMGIEGYFLLRVSDNGLAPNQLQFTTPYGSLSNGQCMLTPNRWTHIAASYDMDAKVAILYIDGVEVVRKVITGVTETASFGKPMSLANNKFYIGFSYEQGREFNGAFSECRIWNTARTPEQIASNYYEVDPASPGLIAYWKFNEGRGKNITDHTGNLNDGVATDILKWTPVSLPAVE